jgi:hypothetical protein
MYSEVSKTPSTVEKEVELPIAVNVLRPTAEAVDDPRTLPMEVSPGANAAIVVATVALPMLRNCAVPTPVTTAEPAALPAPSMSERPTPVTDEELVTAPNEAPSAKPLTTDVEVALPTARNCEVPTAITVLLPAVIACPAPVEELTAVIVDALVTLPTARN